MNKNKTMKLNIVLLTVLLSSSSFQTDKFRDYVPNKATAIKIAEAVWLPIYGEKIYSERPFEATLRGDTLWVVTGTLNGANGYDSTTGELSVTVGGVVYIEIRKKDGKILIVNHGK